MADESCARCGGTMRRPAGGPLDVTETPEGALCRGCADETQGPAPW